ncbi:hypothetical protein ACFQZO_12360 [Bradyrhizobium sp. GCM10027634]|uniref:hypothetical protein n=1 Tax=unclassified Bradyrhizobium TaxID=2631580 RepID=UPI00263B38A1|nr:hypothetical protein [Bradyrhizobium sp. WYCCWR 12677]
MSAKVRMRNGDSASAVCVRMIVARAETASAVAAIPAFALPACGFSIESMEHNFPIIAR